MMKNWIFSLDFCDMKKVMPIDFGEIKMSCLGTKKGPLAFWVPEARKFG